MEHWNPETAGEGALSVRHCGWEECAKGHQFGPAVRDHYLVHFVASGKGRFWTQSREYALEAGQGFVIFPGQVTTYRADTDDPWTYGWMGYTGYGAEPLTRQIGLTRAHPVFTCEARAALCAHIDDMNAAFAGMRWGGLSALGALYQALALIGQSEQDSAQDIHREYYRQAIWYMEGNYQRSVSIEEVARFVGLSRSQLFRVFQSVGHTSPKQCLSTMRMEQARLLLVGSALSPEQIAAAVGVSSGARLGVLFKQTFGLSMGAYRRTKEKTGHPVLPVKTVSEIDL